MALFVMITRKMLKNKWLELSLLLGMILSVSLVSSMPIYTNAILQRMLIKDMEQLQTRSDNYPGNIVFSLSYTNEKPEVRAQRTQALDKIINQAANDSFNVPMLQSVKERRSTIMRLIPMDTAKYDAGINRQADIAALENFEDHIRIIDGRLPAAEQPVDGVYEVMITQRTILDLKLAVGAEYELTDAITQKKLKLKPVGVFERKDLEDHYWSNTPISRFARTFVMPFSVFESSITTGQISQIRSVYYNMVMDYSQMKLTNINDFLSTYETLKTQFSSVSYQSRADSVAFQTVNQYADREEKLRTLLWSMNIPVMIMLAFYLYMVANLIMERQKNEIAVLRSRGASRLQIMTSFFIEGLILSLIALLIGPVVGMLLTKILGASNGFLEFVQRSAMEVRLDKTTYIYALFTVGFSMLMILIPGFLATRISIVGHKQQLARKQKSSIWHKLFLDVILVAVSIYGLVNFNRRMKELAVSGLDASSLSIDPLLFLVPTLFTVGFGLLCLRLYPLFIRVVYWLGRKWWPPSLYSTLIQVGRSSTQYQFLMVFLIMTIATGLFSASAARTMNQNNDDKINYSYGADIVMQMYWQSDEPPPVASGTPAMAITSAPSTTQRVQYVEPNYDAIVNGLPGVIHSAKVFRKTTASITGSQFGAETELIGVDTDDFGNTTWFKDGLLDHHLNDYLNLIAPDPTAILISRSIADQYKVKPGDQVYVGWEMVEPRTFMVYGIIDYFPTFQPNPQEPGAPMPRLVVGHLSAIQSLLAVEPYEIWFKMEPEADRQAFVDALKISDAAISRYVDVRAERSAAKNDPFQLAVNGAMTLGFIISILVSFCGFLLYWILSLHGRILQIGIFRAMGISFKQLIYMLVAEQLLTSGAGIIIGLANGLISSRLFVKFFQLSTNPATQVPPYEVIFDPRDTASVGVIVLIMLVAGLSILAYMLSRIRIHQAVKLGED